MHAEFRALRERLQVSNTALEPGFQAVRKFCRLVREHQMQEFHLIARHGGALLSKHKHKLGDEAYILAEQVFVAALNIGALGSAEQCLSFLTTSVPNGKRVLRLKGMLREAQGQFYEASKIYRDILEKHPADSLTYKRLIAIAKATCTNEYVIELLVEYLNTFMLDAEAWQELLDAYLKQCCYQHAAFCCEELILLQPQNYHFYVLYAEILYTQGKFKNYMLARKYYSFALELSEENNVRALWGLALTTEVIRKNWPNALNKKELDMNSKLFQLAKDMLLSDGASHQSSHLQHLLDVDNATLDRLQFTFSHKCKND
ncbi:ER membrane protein complex subunit 2-A-like [Schistocerca gregaria]|uniref:ER membrane protein complex subunit 2-A-like n=1 Tax=Schistocerca gregaria TaxID=7010 RepID=UPI00211DD2A7|nr:ER membrane protein complex subunit 2-A-like [Schistocerca gregaria]